ncbi:MAG: hypothetical protein FWF10_06945 [Clostridiales bacterium]|nr:hypothetical protein [Clostridiales bacterium]
MNNSRDAYRVEITIVDFVRGTLSAEAQKEFDVRTSDIGTGMELLVLHIRIHAIESKDDAKISITSYDFALVSESGTKYERIYAYGSGALKLGDMYEGATQEGFVFFQVSIFDTNPLIVFKEGYSDPGVWFKLTK